MPWKKSSLEAQRYELVKMLLLRREEVGVICAGFGVSRQTAYKFLRRFKSEGKVGLRDRTRRPHKAANERSSCWRGRTLRLRRSHLTWGSRKLRWLLEKRFGNRTTTLPSERTVQRWLASAGLLRRVTRRRRVHALEGKRCSCARRSNDVWTFDLKGWFWTGNGSKVEPLTIRDLWSRFVLWVHPLKPRNEAAVRRVCQYLFRRYGLPRVIRCDRGAPFFGDGPHGFTRLSLWWWRLGIKVEFVRRGAINNNAHEQMHGVMKKELAIAHTPRRQAHLLERWRRCYNEQRPHEKLGMRVPAACYRRCPAPLPKLEEPRYSEGLLVHRVETSGCISLQNWRGSIGRAFGHLPIGLTPVGPKRYRVYFAKLYLGHLDLNAGGKLDIAPY
jgi:transposase InsO family protein